jgi:tRNA(fMet)-specific endonuclease VapC
VHLQRFIADDDDVAVATITIAELLLGLQLADARRRQKRRAFIDDLLSWAQVEDYDLDVAGVHAALMAHARRSGRQRGAHDLIIAATAAATGRTLLTSEASGFEELPGVSLRLAPLSS